MSTRLFTKEVEHKGHIGVLCVTKSDNEFVCGFSYGGYVSPGKISPTVDGACFSAEKAFIYHIDNLPTEDQTTESLNIHGFTEVKDLI